MPLGAQIMPKKFYESDTMLLNVIMAQLTAI
jgi:hypothetical protein